MMRDTPRTFVGSVVFLLREPVCSHLVDDVPAGILGLSGVSGCQLDPAAGVLVVTARDPVDRADVLATLDRLGCRVRT